MPKIALSSGFSMWLSTCDEPVLAAHLEYFEQESQEIEIRCLAYPRPRESADHPFDDLLKGRGRGRYEEGAKGGAAYDHELRDLHEHEEGPAFHGEPPENRSQDEKDAYNGKHESFLKLRCSA